MANTNSFHIVRPFTVNDSNFVSSNVAENDYAQWSAATTYNLGDRVIVISTNIHNVYESLQASNLNHNPTTDNQDAPVYWILVSKTNRWKMFDNATSSQTQNANAINVVTSYSSRPNSVFFGNVEAQTIRVVMRDSSNTIVFDQTYQMYEDTGTPSYYSWFLSQLKNKKDLFVYPLPAYSNCKIEAYITNTGQTAKCGTMVVGFAEDIGLTELGASVGIQDYSVKQRNEFGDYQILERAFNKRGQFNIFVNNSEIDRLQNTLAEFRATASVYVASTKYASTYIYGFYRDFDIVIAYNNYSLVNIELEGLT